MIVARKIARPSQPWERGCGKSHAYYRGEVPAPTIINGICHLRLHNGRLVKIDREDWERVKAYNWQDLGNNTTPINENRVTLIRAILGGIGPQRCGRRKHHTPDFRRANLLTTGTNVLFPPRKRPATLAQLQHKADYKRQWLRTMPPEQKASHAAYSVQYYRDHSAHINARRQVLYRLRHYGDGRQRVRAGSKDWQDLLLQMIHSGPDSNNPLKLDAKAVQVASKLLADPLFKMERDRLNAFKHETGMSRASYHRYIRIIKDAQQEQTTTGQSRCENGATLRPDESRRFGDTRPA